MNEWMDGWMFSMSSSKYRRACHECQIRHLKCDLIKPCTSCSQAKRSCKQAPKYNFRHDDNPSIKPTGTKGTLLRFSNKQPWPKTPKELRFVAEVPDYIPEGLDEASNFEPGSGQTANQCTNDITTLDDRTWLTTFSGQSPENESSQSLSPEVTSLPVLELSPQITAPYISQTPPNQSISPPVYSQALWPLPTKDEAFLMRYFVSELSLWFDYCDQQRHFATVVIQAASTSPILHNAILAVSSKHLSRTTKNFDPLAPDRYQRESLRKLIPALTNPEAVLDDTLFAATVILRLFDEMTDRIGENDTATHILGSHMLVNARERARIEPISTTKSTMNTKSTTTYKSKSSLRSATLLIELRQEVHIAFMTNRAPPPLVEYCEIDRSLDPTDDWMWAMRIIAYTADILTYCNDGNGSKSLEGWRNLKAYVDEWEEKLPISFSPLYKEDADPENGRLFPVLWFANDCHTAGQQFLAKTKILFAAHNPQIPPLGPDRVRQLNEMNVQIKEQVRIICGIALSNRQFYPTMLEAGIVIAMCGERFTERREQEAFMDILVETEAHVAWPCLTAREKLKACWGWEENTL